MVETTLSIIFCPNDRIADIRCQPGGGEGGFCHNLISFVFLVKVKSFFSDNGGEGSNFFSFRLTSYVHDPYLWFQQYWKLNNVQNVDQEFTDQDFKKQ